MIKESVEIIKRHKIGFVIGGIVLIILLGLTMNLTQPIRKIGGDSYIERNISVIGIVEKIEISYPHAGTIVTYNLVLDKESQRWETEELMYITAPNIEDFVGRRVEAIVDLKVFEWGHILHATKTYSIKLIE